MEVKRYFVSAERGQRVDRFWFRTEEEGSELKAAGSAGTLSQTYAHADSGRIEKADEERSEADDGKGLRGVLPDPDGDGRDGGHGEDEFLAGQGRVDAFGDFGEGGSIQIPRFQGWEGFPTQSPVCRGDDGLPFGVADLSIPFGRWRREAIKALGNAWVPEVAYEIFRMIQEVENGTDEQQD